MRIDLESVAMKWLYGKCDNGGGAEFDKYYFESDYFLRMYPYLRSDRWVLSSVQRITYFSTFLYVIYIIVGTAIVGYSEDLNLATQSVHFSILCLTPISVILFTTYNRNTFNGHLIFQDDYYYDDGLENEILESKKNCNSSNILKSIEQIQTRTENIYKIRYPRQEISVDKLKSCYLHCIEQNVKHHLIIKELFHDFYDTAYISLGLAILLGSFITTATLLGFVMGNGSPILYASSLSILIAEMANTGMLCYFWIINK